jgi:hypothetical protein
MAQTIDDVYDSGNVSSDDDEKAAPIDEMGAAFDCDIDWVTLMNDRAFMASLMRTMLKEAGSDGNNMRFGGACIIGRKRDDLTLLKSPLTLDLVSSTMKLYKPRKRTHQSVYNTYSQFLDANPPRIEKANIYFAGDAHGSGEHISIHWICYIIDLRPPTRLIWYDPSVESGEQGDAYNFSPKKKRRILKTVGKKLPINIFKTMDLQEWKTRDRAQQWCATSPSQDVFCQTWVLMFASVFINGAWEGYKRINFVKWQNQPLKMWARCITSRMPKTWHPMLQNQSYVTFFTKCRRYIPGTGPTLETLPPIVAKPHAAPIVPCILSIITHYLGLDSLYNPKATMSFGKQRRSKRNKLASRVIAT